MEILSEFLTFAYRARPATKNMQKLYNLIIWFKYAIMQEL